MPLVHHELCFGCGRTNLFGLLLEVESTQPGAVAGRCFIKQDHQGATRGTAHEGVVVAALSEAMALASGMDAVPRTLEVQFDRLAPVGAFLEVQAHAEQQSDGLVRARARATSEQRPLARARGVYERRPA